MSSRGYVLVVEIKVCAFCWFLGNRQATNKHYNKTRTALVSNHYYRSDKIIACV